MKWKYLLLGVILCCAGLAVFLISGGKSVPVNRRVFLDVPAPSGKEELMSLRVTVGPLPPGARIVVRSDDGEIIGSIAPFGRGAARAGGIYHLGVPEKLLRARKLSLDFTLEEGREKKARAPTDAEIKEVKLHAGR